MVIVVAESSKVGGFERDSAAFRALDRTMNLIRACGETTIVIASNTPIPTFSGIGLISFSESYPLGNAIADFIRESTDSHVTIVSSELSTMSEAAFALQHLMDSPEAFTFIPLAQGSIPVEFPGMGESGLIPSQLMGSLLPETAVPALGVRATKALLVDAQYLCLSLAGLSFELLIEAYQKGEEIRAAEIEVSIPSDFSSVLVPSRDLARCLRRSVESIPVEELFPSHPWETRQSESAATCYHTLAARFIRFGDLNGAESCLAQSDQLLESPRALALRAVIAMERGETLGAIAKLITSLQEYEQTKASMTVGKSSDGTSSTMPNGGSSDKFEYVNKELKEGLTALNAQDNTRALRHFARAVREFDGFYRDSGLLLLV